MNPDGAEPDAVGADETGFGKSAKGDLMLKQEIPASLEGEPEAFFLAPRCLEWVVTISCWQPEFEFSGDEIDHGGEISG